MRLALTLALIAAPAAADVAEVLDQHILPGVHGFADAASALAVTAAADCTRGAVLPAYSAAFDAWLPIADLRLGPSEAAPLTIAFWPDERSRGARTLAGLIAAGDPALSDPAGFAQQSAAARGFFALDLMLGDAEFAYGTGDPGCALVATLTADLASQAQALAEGWGEWEIILRDPGTPGNVTYLTLDEARGAIFTQIITSLTLTTDTRLARPLGTFDAPHPARAEGWRTGRPLANTLGTVRAAHAMATLLAGAPLPLSDTALSQIERAAAAITDPSFQDIADPAARLKLEILSQRISALREALEHELTAQFGVSLGFNATDGD
jgi:uncharacterized protein